MRYCITRAHNHKIITCVVLGLYLITGIFKLAGRNEYKEGIKKRNYNINYCTLDMFAVCGCSSRDKENEPNFSSPYPNQNDKFEVRITIYNSSIILFIIIVEFSLNITIL